MKNFNVLAFIGGIVAFFGVELLQSIHSKFGSKLVSVKLFKY